MKLSLSICCVQTQTRGEEVSLVLLFFARAYFSTTVCQKAKSQIILKGLLVFLNSPKKQMNEFIFTTMMNSSICCVQTQTRGEVVSPEHLPFASAYFCTTVFQKARATENLTFFKGQKKLKVDWRAIDSPKK